MGFDAISCSYFVFLGLPSDFSVAIFYCACLVSSASVALLLYLAGSGSALHSLAMPAKTPALSVRGLRTSPELLPCSLGSVP